MKKYLHLFIFITSFVRTTELKAQTGTMEIHFKFEHSRRIPNHYVTVDIERHYYDSIVTVKATSTSSSNTKFTEFNIDTSFTTTLAEFRKLAATVLKINSSDISANFTGPGLDGTECEIKFGDGVNNITYQIWSPEMDTYTRKLTDYLNACKAILTIGCFDPDKILGK